jgi:hypothetical protein
MGATPEDTEEGRAYTRATFIQGGVQIRPGLGLVNIAVEPELLTNNRWGRLFTLAYEHPENIAVGLTAGTALVISEDAAQVWGENGIVLLDLSRAALALGANRAYAVANGLIDVFAPGEILHAWPADRSFLPARAATPVIPSPEPTASPGPTAPAGPSTATPALGLALTATATPPNAPAATATEIITFLEDEEEITTPTDPRLLRTMILLGMATVIVILLGVWINRHRINPR